MNKKKNYNKINLTGKVSISSIEEAEDTLIERIEYICNLAAKLKDPNLSREEYNELYPIWIKLYEDRNSHKCSAKPQGKENEISLLTRKQ